MLAVMGLSEALGAGAVMRAMMALRAVMAVGAAVHGAAAPAVGHEQAEEGQAPAQAEERAIVGAIEGTIAPAGTEDAGNEPDDEDEFEHFRYLLQVVDVSIRRAPVRKKTRAVAFVTAQVLPSHLLRTAASGRLTGFKPAGFPAIGYSLARI